MFKVMALVAALTAGGLAHAQAPAAAPSSPAKKELVAKILQLQMPGVEGMARGMAEQPAMQAMQQAGAALQRVPAERREALAKDIEADIRKYVEEATPIVRERAVQVAPQTIGTVLEENFTEEELKQVMAILESPVNRKFQSLVPQMQKALVERVVADTRDKVEPKMRTLEQSIRTRLTGPATGSGAAPAPAPTRPASGNRK